MSKPFFYRIDAGPFLAEVIKTPEEERGEKFLQLALDLVAGKGTFPYSKQIISEVSEFRRKKSEAGKKGMKNRWLHDNSVITNDNTDITKANSVITRSSNRSSSSTVTKDKPKKPMPEYSGDFLSFWSEYPEKSGKGAAWKEWQAHRPPLDQVLAALKWQKETEKWKSGFILDPERYIKKRCWEDEPGSPRGHPPLSPEAAAKIREHYAKQGIDCGF